jgi:hypothetical protein
MNDLYKKLYYHAANECIEQESNEAWQWEKEYARIIILECLSQMSDYLDKERVKKHFGME